MVSVIIPNYNHASFLKQRIDTVLNQTYQDFELIILDDCSTDNSKEIIETYRNDIRISRIVYNDQNSGSTFKQWRRGIELAKGDFIWIAESDDYCDPDFLQKVIQSFTDNPSVGLAYTQSMDVNQNDEISESWIHHTSDIDGQLWKNDFYMNGNEFVRYYMLLKNPVPNASAVLLRKQSYQQAGGCNINYKINGDWDLYTRILANSDIFFFHQALNFYRRHPNKGSATHVSNGNNIKEYYWLAKLWIKNIGLTKTEQRNLLDHIYKIWVRQVRSNSKNLLSYQFMNIFPSAFKVDKKIIFKMISTFK